MQLCPRCSEPYPDDASFCAIDGSSLVRSTDPYLGRTLAARYRLVRRVGTGGMAVVYLARHVMIERLSAIKILRQDLGMNPAHRERFLREARAVNRINHPNIVEITDFGESDGLVFLVMEYVEGESLLAALKRGRFPWTRAAHVAMQIASALGRAHEMNVVHRDLKPENVLLLPRGDADFVKLTDFGIAKILDLPAITFSEQRFGTPGYIAPEYVHGSPASARGDLYALGVCLYEMLCGALPFDAKSAAELLVVPLREAPVKPSARVADVPPEVEELVLRLVARDPEQRPGGAFAVHDALADMLRRAGGSVRPPASGGKGTDRESMVTMQSDPPPSAAPSRRPELTAELAALPTAEIAARWHGMLSDLDTQIEEIRRGRGESDARVRRAQDLGEAARALVASLEKAKAHVAEHQARVDRLEAHGRAFRATLGHALDALTRDRSREQAHQQAIAARREDLDADSTLSGVDARKREALVWEMAALAAEEERAREVESDLSYQIESLQAQLDAQNERLDMELADATGRLEGSLSALRRMTGELVATIEEAASVEG